MAEAQTHDLPTDGIQVASNIHSGDGGEDGRIEWKDGPKRTPNLPSRLCQFQLKAGIINPSQARKEVLTKSGGVNEMMRLGDYRRVATTSCCVPRRIQSNTSCSARIPFAKHSKKQASNIADETGQLPRCRPDSHLGELSLLRLPPGSRSKPNPTPWGLFVPGAHWADRGEHRSSPWVEDERLAPLLRSVAPLGDQLFGVPFVSSD